MPKFELHICLVCRFYYLLYAMAPSKIKSSLLDYGVLIYEEQNQDELYQESSPLYVVILQNHRLDEVVDEQVFTHHLDALIYAHNLFDSFQRIH